MKASKLFNQWAENTYLSNDKLALKFTTEEREVSGESVRQWRIGLSKPRRELWPVISKVTKGAVPIEVWK